MRGTLHSLTRAISAARSSANDAGSACSFEKLEPRILLSADLLGGAVATDLSHSPDNDFNDYQERQEDLDQLVAPFVSSLGREQSIDSPGSLPVSLDLASLGTYFDGDGESGDNLESANAPVFADGLAALLSDAPADEGLRQEIIFIDAATPDYEQLVEGIATDSDQTRFLVFILDGERDGVAQISDVLANYQGIDAIHLVSHGSEGQVNLGNGALNTANVDDYAAVLDDWQNALDGEADLLIYGCNLAGNAAGQDLLQALAQLTGADVAASDDLTGAASLGGDWELEYQIGTIEAQVAFNQQAQQQWQGTLDTFVVTTVNDTVDTLLNDTLAEDAGGQTSLRAAIMEANALGGSHTITLGAGNYVLTIAGSGENLAATGDLDISADITIVGAGIGNTVVDGGGLDRVFHVAGPSSNLVVSGFTIQNGDATVGDPAGGGGAMSVATTATLDNMRLLNNHGADGGAISAHGSVTITDSTIEGHTTTSATGSTGGALRVGNAGFADISNTTFYNNSAEQGGGIYNIGTLTLTNVTLSANHATNGDGGGLFNADDATLNHVTVADNDASAAGGGIATKAPIGATTISNSLVANNIAASDADVNGDGRYTSDGSNFIETVGTVTDFAADTTGNDPRLAGLADNGGSTQTHALTAGSLAIDQGIASAAGTDQRGVARDASPDPGAFEFVLPEYLDRFDSVSYTGSDGSVLWSTPWTEIGEADGSAAAGRVYVGPGVTGQSLLLEMSKGAQREVDLSGVLNATLSFDWSRVSFDPGDTATLEISTDGIAWTLLETFDGSVVTDASSNFASHDISAHLDSDTLIRFTTSYGTGVPGFAIDNVAIDTSGPNPFGLVWVDQAAGKIQVADYDGSNVGDLITGLVSPLSVAVDMPAGKVYWSDDVLNTIQRANFDGTGVETIISSVPGTISIELDLDNGKIYWVEGGGGQLLRANLDGTVIESLVGSPNSPSGIAIDVANDKVYWADPGVDRIKQTSLDGIGTSNLVTSGVGASADIALDLVAGQLYWSDATSGEIRRVDFDGTNITTVISGLSDPYGLSIDSAAGKIYWSDDGTNQIHRANLNGTGMEALVSGIVTPRDIDVVQAGGAAPEASLWLSTNDAATDDKAFVINSNDIVSFGDPDLRLELGDGSSGSPTDGTFATEATLPENVRALHHVNSVTTVDTFIGGATGTYDLQPGQIVVSLRAADTLDFDVLTVGAGTITVNNTDVLVYTPGTGEYEFLLEDAIMKPDNITPANIHAISIVEQSTDIGVDTTLAAGTYLIARSDPSVHADISTFDNTNGRRDLLLGTDFLSGSDQIQGLELLESSRTVGDITLAKGTLLVTIETTMNVGSSGGTIVSAEAVDVVALTINATEQDSVTPDTNVDAQIFFDGSDIALSIGGGTEINGLTLMGNILGNSTPTVNATASDTGTEDTDQVYTHAQMLTLVGAADVDDIDADLSVAITNVNNGSVALSGGSGGVGTTFTFTPTADFVGNLTFDYRVSDDESPTPANSALGTATVALAADNDAPTVNATASDTGTEDTDQVYTHAQMLTLVGASDVDDIDADLSVAITNVNNGSVALSGGSGGVGTTFTFTPTADFVGNLTFDYRVSDDESPTPANSALGTATVALAADNDAPTVNATASDTGTEDTDQVYTHAQMLTLVGAADVDDIDADLSVAITNVNNGSVALSGGSGGVGTTFTFTPTADFVGNLTFDYRVSDDESPTPANSALGTATVALAADNDAPTVNATASDTGTEDTDQVYTHAQMLTLVGAADVDDIDADLSVAITNVNNGSVALSGGSGGVGTTFTFTPTADFVGNLTFDYRVSDDESPTPANSALGTATVALAADNDAPTVNATASDTGTEDTDQVYTHAQMLTLVGAADVDDIDADLSVAITNVNNGSVALSGGSGGVGTTFTFTPTADFVGNLTFDYRVSDDESPTPANSALGTATVALAADNDAPTVNATASDTGTEDTDQVYTHAQMLTLVGAADVDDIDADLSVAITNVNNGSVALSGGSGGVGTTFTFTPTADFVGNLTFDYRVSDDESPTPANSALGTATVALAADNDAPTVNATASDTGTEDTDQVYTHAQMLTLVGAADVDDIDADLSVAITNVNNGSVALSGGSGGVGTTFTFTPTADFVGNLTFDYRVSDDESPTPANSALGTATVALSADNDAPTVAVPIAIFINEIHYDNIGPDSGEAIEIAGVAGNDLDGWQLVLYSGFDGSVYGTMDLSGTIPNQADNFGTLAFNFPADGIQNATAGNPDGIALIDPTGAVAQFLSYEGAFTATEGPANGVLSTDIGVAEDNGSTAVGDSLQLTGPGPAFTWATPSANTLGAINTGQDFAALAAATHQAVNEDTALVFNAANGNAISVDDVDAAFGAALDPVSVTLNVSDGTLALATTTGLGTVLGDGTNSISFTGTIAELNAALDGLTYQGDPGFNGSDTLTLLVDDQGNSGAGGNLLAKGIVHITVDPLQDAPTLSGGPYNLGSTDEDNASTGVQVSTILAGLTANDNDGDALGIAVTAATGNGEWEYSTNSTDGSDGNWTDFDPVLASSALLLSDTSWVRYEPDDVSGESVSIDFRAWDGTTGTASTTGTPVTVNPGTGGGSSAYSTGSAQAGLTVSDLNDVPGGSGSLSSTSLNDNVGATNLFGGLTVADVDTGENDLVLRITLSNPAAGTVAGGSFTDQGGGVYTVTGLTVAQANTALDNVQFTPAGNTGSSGTFNTDISVDVDDDDSGFQSVLSATTVTITRINDDPILVNPISDQSATEDTPFSFIFAAGIFNDVDAGDSLAYTAQLAGGGALPGWLTFNEATRTFSGTPLNADVGTISIEVTADDGNLGTPATNTFDIVVANTNDDPTLDNAIADQSATEDTAFNFTFAANTFGDLDAGDTLTYSSDASGWLSFDAATRTFSGTPLNADVGTITVTVTADDGNGGTPATDTFAIVISNQNDAPTGPVVISSTLAENEVLTATVTLADEDGLGALNYQWQRDGVDIAGATGTSYTLTDADTGAVITMVVSYTDARGTAESVTSNALYYGILPVDDGLAETNTEPATEVVEIEEIAPLSEQPEAVVDPEPDIADIFETSTTDAGEPEVTVLDNDSDAAVQSISGEIDRKDDTGDLLPELNDPLSEQPKPLVNLVTMQADFTLYNDPLVLVNFQGFSDGIDKLRDEVTDSRNANSTVVGSTFAVSAGLSAGYVAWLARSGAILSSVLSALPAWRFIDPLPVLTRSTDGSEDDESLQSLIDDSAVDNENETENEPEVDVQTDDQADNPDGRN